MKIAIIGAGFTGLSAAWELSKADYDITIFEKESIPAGLASGFSASNWSWTLEYHYHHIFKSDDDILNMIRQMGLNDFVFFKNVNTSIFYDQQFYRLDSALSLMKLPILDLISKLRTGLSLAIFKVIPNGGFLGKYSAADLIIKMMSQQSYQKLWEPLFNGKFGSYSTEFNAAWFWARIHTRTKELGYFHGGFLNLAKEMVKKLQKNGVNFRFETELSLIDQADSKLKVEYKERKKYQIEDFDQVLLTDTAESLESLVPGLDKSFVNKYNRLPYLGAQTLVLSLKKKFLKNDIYWLNINEKNWPFLAVVERFSVYDVTEFFNTTDILSIT